MPDLPRGTAHSGCRSPNCSGACLWCVSQNPTAVTFTENLLSAAPFPLVHVWDMGNVLWVVEGGEHCC